MSNGEFATKFVSGLPCVFRSAKVIKCQTLFQYFRAIQVVNGGKLVTFTFVEATTIRRELITLSVQINISSDSNYSLFNMTLRCRHGM